MSVESTNAPEVCLEDGIQGESKVLNGESTQPLWAVSTQNAPLVLDKMDCSLPLLRCSGSIVVYSARLWTWRSLVQVLSGCHYSMRLDRQHMACLSLHPFQLVHQYTRAAKHIEAVTGAGKLIDGCSLELCSATPLVASSGICHRNKVDSIAWLLSRWPCHEIVSVTYYITFTKLGVFLFFKILGVLILYKIECSLSLQNGCSLSLQNGVFSL